VSRGRSLTARRTAARFAFLATLVAAAALTGCHELVNPWDPNSTTYTGEDNLRDPPPTEPVLPPIERWESVAEHGTGQFLGLPIASDGSFVEPRQPADPTALGIVITFEETFDRRLLSETFILVRVSVAGGATTTERVFPNVDMERRQIVIRAEPPFPPFFNAVGDGSGAAMVRVLIVDPTGLVHGERVFGILPGDFDGDGTVSADDDWTGGAAAFAGRLADGTVPATIRADADADGVVAAFSADQTIVETRNVGSTLPASPPPAF